MTDKPGGKAIKSNPALKPFEVLVGEWQTTAEHPYFPDSSLKGRTTIEWIEGGAFLLMRSEIDHPKFPDGIAIIGSDGDSGEYYQIYFDERGVSRKYDVTISGRQIMWKRDDDHLSQRFTITTEKDKLVSTGEMSRNGGEWEKDLSVIYERL